MSWHIQMATAQIAACRSVRRYDVAWPSTAEDKCIRTLWSRSGRCSSAAVGGRTTREPEAPESVSQGVRGHSKRPRLRLHRRDERGGRGIGGQSPDKRSADGEQRLALGSEGGERQGGYNTGKSQDEQRAMSGKDVWELNQARRSPACLRSKARGVGDEFSAGAG